LIIFAILVAIVNLTYERLFVINPIGSTIQPQMAAKTP